ncbi:MAG TPA: molecular chaperone DnaK, partial [Dehalococcoidia bacterium]|nr:molecular chaperone DnaK [Dehalococcoidia bacterium]
LRSEVEGKVAAVRSALSGSDVSYLKSTAQELSEALQKVGAAVYQQEAPPPKGEAPGEGEEGTVEGEFREV